MWLLIGFFRSIPIDSILIDLEECAMIDGAPSHLLCPSHPP